MFKRLFFAMLGLGVGLLVGTWAVRKAEHARAKLTPGAVGAAASQRVERAGSRWRQALEAGRRAAADREAELRAVYRGGNVDGEPRPTGPAGGQRPA